MENFHPIVNNILIYLINGLTGALVMALALTILIKVWNWVTPIDEWEELKKGNVAVAIVMAAVLIAMGIVVSATFVPGH